MNKGRVMKRKENSAVMRDGWCLRDDGTGRLEKVAQPMNERALLNAGGIFLIRARCMMGTPLASTVAWQRFVCRPWFRHSIILLSILSCRPGLFNSLRRTQRTKQLQLQSQRNSIQLRLVPLSEAEWQPRQSLVIQPYFQQQAENPRIKEVYIITCS